MNEVLELAMRYARKVFGGDEERIALTLVLAWYIWSRRQQDFPPQVYANIAVKHVFAGRDLPGVRKPGPNTDVWDNLSRWGGGTMKNVRCKRPGPERLAIWREEYDRIKGRLTARELDLFLAMEADPTLGTAELADQLDITPARVSQLKRAIAGRGKD